MRKIRNIAFSCFTMTLLAISLVGCGKNTTTGSTSGNNDPTLEDNADSMTDNIGDAAEDLADGVGDAASDVIDGTGNAVNDLLGDNGFDNYNDAHDYFLESMGNYHSDAKFELRDENKELTDYQEGSKGYHFSLYDTSKNSEGDMFGEFYVDAASGLIYRIGDNGTIEEYPGKSNTTVGSHMNSKKKTNSNKSNTLSHR